MLRVEPEYAEAQGAPVFSDEPESIGFVDGLIFLFFFVIMFGLKFGPIAYAIYAVATGKASASSIGYAVLRSTSSGGSRSSFGGSSSGGGFSGGGGSFGGGGASGSW